MLEFSVLISFTRQIIFLFETLHIRLRRHICLTQVVILSSTSNFFATIASLCNNVTTSSKKNVTNVYVFLLCHYHVITPTDHSQNTGFFQRVQKVTSVSCNGLISIDFVHFGFVVIDNFLSRNLLLFSCHPIGQLCLGGPGYSCRTVMCLPCNKIRESPYASSCFVANKIRPYLSAF